MTTTINNVKEFDKLVETLIQKADQETLKKYNGDVNKHFSGCGFAWTKIDIDGRSKLGRIVRKSDNFEKAWDYGYTMWTCGVASATQNIDVKEFWQRIIANGLKEAGFDAFVGSRLD